MKYKCYNLFPTDELLKFVLPSSNQHTVVLSMS